MTVDEQRAPRPAPTLSPAKQALLSAWSKGRRGNRDEIPRRGDDGPAPLSFSQQRLWFLERMVPDSPAYNTPMAVELRGPLDVTALRDSVRRIIDRHEALRTTIQESDGEPVQVVSPTATVDLPVTDLSDLSEAERDARVRQALQEEARRTFVLAVGPLVRFGLFRLTPRRHVFLVNWSHLIADGWSGRVFSRELAECYSALVTGGTPRLPELKLQYADYAVWQRAQLTGPALARQVRYWRERLDGIPALLELPTDRPRPTVQSFRGDTLRFTVDERLTGRLRALCAGTDSTLFMVWLAAFTVVLSRWSGQRDVVVGTPVANRNRPELEDLFGFFANTLALRTTVTGDPTFRQLLARVGADVSADFAHQDLPFEKLVDELQPERSTSHNPVFQAMLALNNTPPPRVDLTADTQLVGLVEGDTGSAKFDLWLSLADAGDTLPGGLEFATDLFDRDTVERILASLLRLLDQVCADPDAPLSRLDLVDAEERHRVLRVWNDTAAPEPTPRVLHELIAEQARRTPRHVAVRLDNRSLTYAELDRRGNRLANRLRRHGVRPDSRVAVCLDRSPELLVALLGVIKAGGCYVPLDPDHPPARLAYLLADCAARVVLTGDGGRDVLPAGGPPVIDLHRDDCADESERAPASGVTEDDLTYVIYTSGSTGLPKGVMNSHRAVVNRLRWMQRRFGLTAGEAVLQKTPASFDVSVWEFFWPLLVGATVTMARPDGHRDPGYLADLINDQRISTVHFVPSMLRLFLDEPRSATCTGLRRVVCSGEALPRDLVHRFQQRLPARLDNLYGPTEAAVDVTAHRCPPGEDTADVSIGAPVDNTRIYVLDPAGRPVPVGVPGELCIGGIQVARGYQGRPALTAERFVPDPFTDHPGARMYRTGDIARWRPGGTLSYLGRADLQVKLGGIRFELGEAEAALREHPTVRDAVVTVRRDTGDEGQLVAYVVPHAEPEHPGPAGPSAADRPPVTDVDGTVRQWARVFDEAYTEPETPDAAERNYSSWNSSYTGAPIPADEMRRWVDETVSLTLTTSPGRVLEVGCGLGLLLLRIAPHAAAYHGTDISRFALDQLRDEVQARALTGVTLDERAAHELAELPDASFDTVLLNSVVQYFPDVDYLRQVLEQCLRLVAPGGRLIVGDVRSLPLLTDFHRSVELRRADPDDDLATVLARATARTWQEEELALDPALFTTLPATRPGVAAVEVRLKPGGYDNELSRFRYDVVVHVAADPTPDGPATPEPTVGPASADTPDPVVDPASDPPDPAVDPLGWDADLAGRLRERLGEEPAVAVTGIPNERLREVAVLRAGDAACRTVRELRARIDREPAGVDPDALHRLADDLGVRVVVGPSTGDPTRMDALFHRADLRPSWPPAPPTRTGALANWPRQARLMGELGPRWRAHLKDRIPRYAVPSVFVPVPDIPLSLNGKVAWSDLPAPPPVAARDHGAHVAPADGTERLVADIWAAVLGLERVSATANYFELGGDSIRGIRVMARANQAGLPLVPRDLFAYPTVAELAAVADTRLAEGGAVDAPTADPAQPDHWHLSERDRARREQLLADPDVTEVFPLAPYQAHMLRRLVADRRPGEYLVQRVDTLRGPIDVDLLRRCWAGLAGRYALLRTMFVWTGLDEPLQVVRRDVELPSRYADWTGLTATEQDTELARFLREDQAVGCAPEDPAGIRLFLAKVDEDAYRTVFSFSYLRMEGWSLSVFLSDVIGEYHRLLAGQTPLAGEDVPFSRYVGWLRRRGVPADTPGFWRQMFADGWSPTPLATSTPGNRPGTQRGYARQHLQVDARVTEALRDTAQRLRMPPNTLVQAAWAVLLARYAGRGEATLGVFFNGRPADLPGIEDLTGPTMNVLPMRVRLPEPDRPVAELLRHVMTLGADAAHHQYVAPERVAEWAGWPADRPMFDAYLVFQNLDPTLFGSTERIPTFFSRLAEPFRLDVMPGVELGLILSYHRDLLTDDAAGRVLDDLVATLAAITADPHRPIAETLRPPARPAAAKVLLVEGELGGHQIKDTPFPVPAAEEPR
ncbi:amino acid adenylation domain-containing protein [Plantactinospora sp. GCM10030261]|uniref:non-ribosomal peptide synthetase n=1 Tax=Plantactinospora sp. GCM10030261 TaxID=3273420 RepID=UPI00361E8179